ncbi:cytochrome C oxidase subunit IV family protein [Calditrichota bacterium]
MSQIDLGPWNLIVALAIAFFKASLVVLFFMHLLYDNKMFMLVIVSSLLFLAIFISFTMFDTMRRGDMYEEVGQPINKDAFIYTVKEADSTATVEGEHGEVDDHGGGH